MRTPRLGNTFSPWTWIPAFLLLFSAPALPQNVTSAASRQQSMAEQRTARALETTRANSLDLHAFLVEMPKGSDLHSHLSGAVYAESWIRAAAEDGLCVKIATLSFVKPVHDPGKTPEQMGCDDGNVPAGQAYKDQHLYDALINGFSMRSYVPSPGVSGHDHFLTPSRNSEAPIRATRASGSTKWLRGRPRRMSSIWN